MNWEIIGATGEWAGALAVVVTLFYLARQVSQANQIGAAEAEREWFDAWHEIVRSLSPDLEIAGIVQSGLKDYVSLSPAERAVFHGRIAGIFNHTDLAIRLNQRGLLSQDIVDTTMDLCMSIIITDGGKDWWDGMGSGFPIHSQLVTRLAENQSHITPFSTLSAWSLNS